MRRNQQGLSLVELLISIVISSIILGAAYASYMVISNNFEFQKDMKYMSQTARAVVKMIARDVRMAGYQDFNATSISEAIKVTDSSNNCCDRIDIIYDKSSSERVKISYYTKQYQNRNRLMKLVMRCTVSDCTKTSTLQSEQPIADYVEDLQFSTLREGVAVRTSSTPTWGTGKIGWFKPTSVKADCADVYPALGPSKSGKLEFLFDDDMSTSWTCKMEAPRKRNAFGRKNAYVTFTFNPPVRLMKVMTGPSGQIDGGSSKGCYRMGQKNCFVYPYASKRSLAQHIGYGSYTTAGYVKPATFTPQGWTFNWSAFNTKFADRQGGSGCECYHSYNTCIKGLCEIRNTSNNVGTWSHYVLISEYTLKFPSPVILDYPKGSNYADMDSNHRKNTGYVEVPEIQFFGEVWGAPATPDQVEIGLLLRSPNEHQTKSKSFSINMGNRSFASNDRYMRDSFSTSVIVRNLYYASH